MVADGLAPCVARASAAMVLMFAWNSPVAAPAGLTLVMLTCLSEKKNITGSDNGLPPGQCQAIIYTNVGQLLIGPLGTNFGEI